MRLLALSAFFRAALLAERMYWPLYFAPVLQAFLMAAVFWLVLGSRGQIGGVAFFEFLAPGLLAATVVQRGYESTSFDVMAVRYSRAVEDWYMAPIHGVDILLGLLCPAVLRGVYTAVVMLVGFGLFMGSTAEHVALVLVLLLLLALMGGAAGILAALVSERWDGLSAWESYVFLPVVAFSPCYFPYAVLEGWWAEVLWLNPLAGLVTVLRSLYLGEGVVWGLLVYPVVLCGVFLVGAGVLLQRGYKIKA